MKQISLLPKFANVFSVVKIIFASYLLTCQMLGAVMQLTLLYTLRKYVAKFIFLQKFF